MAKPTELMNALDLLNDQHSYLDVLFERVEAKDSDQRAAFVELADCLDAHAAIEEEVFYPRVMSDATCELLHESHEEHVATKDVLADLQLLHLDSPEFDAKLSVLKELVSHHAHDDEEHKLFPIVRSAMTAEELAVLGHELLALFEALIKAASRRHVHGTNRRPRLLRA